MSLMGCKLQSGAAAHHQWTVYGCAYFAIPHADVLSSSG